jgi:hypothetical protein
MVFRVSNKGCRIVTILLVFFFAGPSSVLANSDDYQNNSISAMNIANGTIPGYIAPGDIYGEIDTTYGANITNNTSNMKLPNLKYIWSVSGIENDQIVMALNQDGNDLFGQAKYEPDGGQSWNGVVAGFVRGDQVHLAIAATEGNESVSTVLDGILADQTISGRFIQTSGGKIAGSGMFNAVSINPDLSSYIPAKVEKFKPEPEATVSNISAPLGTNETSQQVVSQKSRFHDVHQDADRIQTGVGDISQIPIGMG